MFKFKKDHQTEVLQDSCIHNHNVIILWSKSLTANAGIEKVDHNQPLMRVFGIIPMIKDQIIHEEEFLTFLFYFNIFNKIENLCVTIYLQWLYYSLHCQKASLRAWYDY